LTASAGSAVVTPSSLRHARENLSWCGYKLGFITTRIYFWWVLTFPGHASALSGDVSQRLLEAMGESRLLSPVHGVATR
jgi:hypothetical protein